MKLLKKIFRKKSIIFDSNESTFYENNNVSSETEKETKDVPDNTWCDGLHWV